MKPEVSKVDLSLLESYDYNLPPEQIAQFPITPRDASKLLVVSRDSAKFQDSVFRSLAEHLQQDDLVVLNDTKVIPARILSERGEILLVREVENSCWDSLVFPGKHFKPGTKFQLGNVHAEVLTHSKIGRLIKLSGNVDELLTQHGKIPLPPYIDREATEMDRKRYQTIYARKTGSIAAPTAGMHFTQRVMKELREKHIEICKLTLHVGPGTFRPVKTHDIRDHHIDPEYYYCTQEAWKKIRKAQRVIAVGTTTTRALESIALTGELEGFANLFIHPGHDFKIVKGLITNFHLPKSSLLMLVTSFGGYELIRAAYQYAISARYRFYSYGDAMLIV
jgi:S-adenosylmethionine:tRNA ribosyltransferase-isomerase